MAGIKGYNFWLEIETPSGGCVVRAETYQELLRLAPAGIVKQVAKTSNLDEETELNALAKRALSHLHNYRTKHRRRYGSYRIEEEGVALDVVKFYLRGWHIHQVIVWLKKNKKVELSNGAIGRFYQMLKKAGINRGFPFSDTL